MKDRILGAGVALGGIFLFAVLWSVMYHPAWLRSLQPAPEPPPPRPDIRLLQYDPPPLRELPPTPDAGVAYLERSETPLQMHMREALHDRDPGWCSTFCSEIGGEQYHQQAFREALPRHTQFEDRFDIPEEGFSEEEWDARAQQRADEITASMGEDMCVCRTTTLMHDQHVLAVPYQRAYFNDDWHY